MVVSAQPDLPQAPRLAVAVSFIIAAMILVVAVRPWWGRTERTKGDAAVLVLPLVAVAVGTAVVVPDSWSVRGGPGLLPLLPVLSAGPWAAIALRPTSGLRRVVRLVLACALVIPLGFAAFAVAGVYVTPVLLFVTLVLLLVRASSSVGSTAPGAPVTAVLAVAAVTAGLAAIPWWGIDDPVLWMVAPVPAALMGVGLFPERLSPRQLIAAAALLLAASTTDAVLPDVDAIMWLRVVPGLLFGHMAVQVAAVVPWASDEASPRLSAGPPSPTRDPGYAQADR